MQSQASKPCGFKNFRSTCFANAVFQALCCIPELMAYLRDVDAEGMRYTAALQELFRPVFEGQDVVIDPPEAMRTIIEGLQRESGQNQMDACEFYTTLVDALHTEALAAKGDSEDEDDDSGEWEEVGFGNKRTKLRSEKTDGTSAVSRVLRGTLRVTTSGETKKKKSAVMQDFYVASLPMQIGAAVSTSLGASLGAFQQLRHTDAQKTLQTQFERVPPVLVLQLNRFVYDRVRLRPVKLDGAVAFKPALEIASARAKRRLVAVVEHQGPNLGRGHYVAAVRRGTRWWLCNDARVVPTDEASVLQMRAYLLFYTA